MFSLAFYQSGRFFVDEFTELKEKLELEKLRLEIRYFRSSFRVQIFNSLVLLVLGSAVLLFFRWPQIVQMESARIENERNHVASLILSAQGISNSSDKKMSFK
jgi:hypothetical protein